MIDSTPQNHMMGLGGAPFIYWAIGLWVIFLFFAFLVYKDAKEHEKNAILWFILVALPWIGILFLIAYMVMREEEPETTEDIKNRVKALIDERYARGEISREEYRQIKKDIEEGNKWKK